MTSPDLNIRLFDREADYPLICEWWEFHGHAVLPIEMLPKLGIIIQDVETPKGALWLYMDNSCGVCFLERAVSVPGLRLKDAKEIFKTGIEFLKIEADKFDYGVMFVRCSPSIARILEDCGFHGETKKVVQLFCSTRPVEPGK